VLDVVGGLATATKDEYDPNGEPELGTDGANGLELVVDAAAAASVVVVVVDEYPLEADLS